MPSKHVVVLWVKFVPIFGRPVLVWVDTEFPWIHARLPRRVSNG